MLGCYICECLCKLRIVCWIISQSFSHCCCCCAVCKHILSCFANSNLELITAFKGAQKICIFNTCTPFNISKYSNCSIYIIICSIAA